MKYLGDLAEDQIIDFHFSTHKADGTPITLAGTPVVKVYKGNSTTTEATAGVTLDVDFDAVTGLHHVRIDTSADAFYAIANDYSVVITTGAVDGVSVIGTVLATFSIENRFIEADVAKWLGTAPLALSTQQVQAVVPTTQKVDVETIKTFPVSLNAAGVTFPLVVGNSTYAGSDTAGITELLTRIPDATAGANGGLLIAGSNAATTFATLTVTSGNINADVKAWNGGALPTIGTSTLTTGDIDARLVAWGKTGFSISGTLTTLDALLTQLATAHGAGSWVTATGFSTHSAADVVTALGTGSTLTACLTATGFSTLDAAGVRTAVGLATANLDTQLSAISGYVDCLPATWVTVSTTAEIKTALEAAGGHLALILEDTGTTLPSTLSTIAGYVDTEVASILTIANKIDTALVADGAVYQFTANALELAPSGTGGDATAANQTTIINHLTGIKGATWSGTTDSLEAIRDRGDVAWITGGDAGSGAWTITVTVNDGTNVLEGATVRFTKGALSYSGSTNSSGQVVFALDSGTWAVAITLSGCTFTPSTLVVSASASQTYSMSAVTVPASNPGRVTGYLYCYDEDGVPEVGAAIEIQFHSLDGSGVGYDSAVRTELSNADGMVTFTNLFVGADYMIRRGVGEWKQITISLTATSPYALTSILGEEA